MQSNNDDVREYSSSTAEAMPVFRSAKTIDQPTCLPPNFRSDPSVKTQDQSYDGLTSSNIEAQSKNAPFHWITEGAPIPFYQLERAITIAYTPQIVATRLQMSFRDRSVVAEYNNSTALCTTSEFLKYNIHLYVTANGETKMEVMRHSGCGFKFRTEREAVINAANGLGSVVASSLPFMMNIPESFLKNYKAPTVRELEDMLCRATDRVHSNQQDEQLFIFQNLASLTAPNKVNRESTLQMSKLILKNTMNISSIIVEFIKSCTKDTDENNKILNACLTIFSNTMLIVSEEEKLGDVFKQNDSLVETLVPELVGIVEKCTCLHIASIALKCLCLLLNNSPNARDVVTPDTREFVINAQSIGQRRHYRLQEEAKLTLAALPSGL